MFEAFSVVADVRACAYSGSVIATELLRDLGADIVLPCSIFLLSLAATLDVTQVGPRVLLHSAITSASIPRPVEILCL
jgi:hypothetical protein